MQRGDVVIVAFPFATGGGGKNRPAAVAQCDRHNQRLSSTIVATEQRSWNASGGDSRVLFRRLG
jgi:mRNA-degrading endonuclease toxin of MazEF toxin-antitoxin module